MHALTRRWGVNLGLLIMAGGLLMLGIWGPDQERAMIPPLFGGSPTEIKDIEVLRLDQETLTFTRREGLWQMTAPNEGPANPILINQLFQEATVHCPHQYPVSELDLKALSLDPPRLRLRLDDQEIRFGATAPTDGLRYVQTGARVHLCPDRLYRLLTSAAASFLAPPIESLSSPASRSE